MYLNVTTSTIHLLASLILIWTVKYKEKTHNIKRILSDSIYLAIHPSIYLHSAPRFCDSDLAVLRAISVVREVFTEEAQLGALGAQTLAGDNCVNSWKNTSHVRLTGSRVGFFPKDASESFWICALLLAMVTASSSPQLIRSCHEPTLLKKPSEKFEDTVTVPAAKHVFKPHSSLWIRGSCCLHPCRPEVAKDL